MVSDVSNRKGAEFAEVTQRIVLWLREFRVPTLVGCFVLYAFKRAD